MPVEKDNLLKAIKAEITDSQLSAQQISSKTGLSLNDINKIISEGKPPSLDVLFLLADSLYVDGRPFVIFNKKPPKKKKGVVHKKPNNDKWLK